eukprot:6180044-Pleurochrysis_carterae.AAC.4
MALPNGRTRGCSTGVSSAPRMERSHCSSYLLDTETAERTNAQDKACTARRSIRTLRVFTQRQWLWPAVVAAPVSDFAILKPLNAGRGSKRTNHDGAARQVLPRLLSCCATQAPDAPVKPVRLSG